MTIQQAKPFSGSNRTTLQEVRASDLTLLPGEPRRHSKRDLELARETVERLPTGAPLPIVINGKLEILDGIEFVDAARELGIEVILVLQHDGMTPVQEKQYRVAIDQLQSRGSWDANGLEDWVRLFERDIENFDHAMLGFDSGELDKVLGIPDRIGGEEAAVPSVTSTAISERGSIWKLAHHRLMVGDATSSEDLRLLMAGRPADAAITDPPYGCPVDGFVAKKGKHRDFIEGAGDKTPEELAEFFSAFARNLSGVLRPGALVFTFIDWRSLHLLQRACEPIFGSLVQLVCWVKDRGGMGGLYRSQHELVLVYRHARGKHVNAVQLGKHGRNRSNVWSHPCAASSRRGREGHEWKGREPDADRTHCYNQQRRFERDLSEGEVMGSPVLHVGTGVICAHGGSASPTTSFERVKVGGQPVLTVTSSFLIADCAGDPSAPTSRCVVATFLTGASRVLAGGAPVALQHNASVCEPTGTPLTVTFVQSRGMAA